MRAASDQEVACLVMVSTRMVAICKGTKVMHSVPLDRTGNRLEWFWVLSWPNQALWMKGKTAMWSSIVFLCVTSLRLLLPAVGAVLYAASADAQDLDGLPHKLLEKVEAAQQTCLDFENGQFTLEFGAVHRVDLDGDNERDWVLDEAGFNCSTAASLYCGTGGCMSHFLTEDRLLSLLNQGWDLRNMGAFLVLLVDVHGSQCGGINPTPCVTASVWDPDDKIWRSAKAEWE